MTRADVTGMMTKNNRVKVGGRRLNEARMTSWTAGGRRRGMTARLAGGRGVMTHEDRRHQGNDGDNGDDDGDDVGDGAAV